MEIVEYNATEVVYKTKEGDTVICPLTKQAREILHWYLKNIPANNQ